jgi:uncharacterized protein YbjT (DUF2867 family)
MVDPRDVAAVVGCRTHDREPRWPDHELSGPEAIMYEHVADELSAATGRQVDFVAVPDEGARQGLLEAFRLLVSSLRGRGLVAHVELR